MGAMATCIFTMSHPVETLAAGKLLARHFLVTTAAHFARPKFVDVDNRAPGSQFPAKSFLPA